MSTARGRRQLQGKQQEIRGVQRQIHVLIGCWLRLAPDMTTVSWMCTTRHCIWTTGSWMLTKGNSTWQYKAAFGQHAAAYGQKIAAYVNMTVLAVLAWDRKSLSWGSWEKRKEKKRSMVTDSGTFRPGYTLATAVTDLLLSCISAIRCRVGMNEVCVWWCRGAPLVFLDQ